MLFKCRQCWWLPDVRWKFIPEPWSSNSECTFAEFKSLVRGTARSPFEADRSWVGLSRSDTGCSMLWTCTIHKHCVCEPMSLLTFCHWRSSQGHSQRCYSSLSLNWEASVDDCEDCCDSRPSHCSNEWVTADVDSATAKITWLLHLGTVKKI